MECLITHLLHVYCCTLLLSPYILIAADGSPKAGNRIELEAMLDQVRNNNQTAQMAMLTAHKERVEWDHEGGRLPLQSQYGKVCFPAPPRCPPLPLGTSACCAGQAKSGQLSHGLRMQQLRSRLALHGCLFRGLVSIALLCIPRCPCITCLQL